MDEQNQTKLEGKTTIHRTWNTVFRSGYTSVCARYFLFSVLTSSSSLPISIPKSLVILSNLRKSQSFNQTMAINKESIPPPVIGKIGPYTVFMTPPSTPKPSDAAAFDSPKKISPPPVQPPPQVFHKPSVDAASSVSGLLKNAVTKVQTVHSSLDDHLARWFGLNQSKYQWALDDYYESKGMEKGDMKAKEMSSKVQGA